jgi:nucleoid-associated protein YgaU
MPSQSTLIWTGATAAAIAVAAGVGALVWTQTGYLRSPGSFPSEAPASAPAAPPAPPAAANGQTPAPAAAAEPPGQAANQTAPSPAKPAFDVVNVEPTGEAVIAGRAEPNAKVELTDAGKPIAEATADASGQFVIIPPPLSPGGHSLALEATAGAATPETSDAVAVSVPAPEAKEAVVASTTATPSAPSPATQTLSTSLPADAARVAIQSVEAEANGGLLARGSAEPNAVVRLYLNDADLADAKTQSDGRWSLTIKRGMAPGAYAVRADRINPPDTKVAATAEMRFDYPTAPAGAGPPAPAPNLVASASDAVVDSIQTAQIASGHTLWALSKNYYGDPTRYPVIYEANKAQIHNPNLIYPGQVFVVPKFDPKP